MDNGLFSDKQFGFIPKRSVMLQLLNVVDKWTDSLESGGQVDIIYTDLEKAFDKVSHTILIHKLYSYGINTTLCDWIKQYLSKREFCVKVNGVKSVTKNQLSGIPQGSILGPLLFVVFINDLPNVCPDEDLYMFADDTKIFKLIQNINDSLTLNETCQSVYDWCEDWGMKINIEKCKVLSLHPHKNKIEYTYNFTDCHAIKTEILHTDEFCDLGVTIDSKLSFKMHISNKINKASQMLGIIKRNFKLLDITSFKILYTAQVRSHLEFCNSVWNPHSVELTEEIEKIQKRATKLVSQCKGLTYFNRLKFLNLPILKYRRLRGDMIEIFKMLNGNYDVDIIPNLTRGDETRTRGHGFKLGVQRTKYNLRKFSFTNRVVNFWNLLPSSIVNANSVVSFKTNFDKHMKNKDIYFDYKADTY